jgi:hypothetical protein
MRHKPGWRNAGLAVAIALSLAGCSERMAPDPAAAVARAYGAVPPASRMALRLTHLKGYVLAASQLSEPAAAAALVSQGMLEVYDAQPGAFNGVGLNEGALRTAASQGTPADIQTALAGLTTAQVQAGGDPVAVLRAMTRLAAGLYESAGNGGGMDNLEYQHSLGAALAARELAANDPRLAKARRDLDGLVALWPSPNPPIRPAPSETVDAQAARIIADLA